MLHRAVVAPRTLARCLVRRLCSDDMRGTVRRLVINTTSASVLSSAAVQRRARGREDDAGACHCAAAALPHTFTRTTATDTTTAAAVRRTMLSRHLVVLVRGRCVVRVPTPACVHFDGVMTWARYAATEQARQYAARCRLAQLQTLGGGWASLQRAREAMRCARAMLHIARALHDDEVAAKCRVFVAWGLLWQGRRSDARVRFAAELRRARRCGDVAQQHRCLHALHLLQEQQQQQQQRPCQHEDDTHADDDAIAHTPRAHGCQSKTVSALLAQQWAGVFAANTPEQELQVLKLLLSLRELGDVEGSEQLRARVRRALTQSSGDDLAVAKVNELVRRATRRRSKLDGSYEATRARKRARREAELAAASRYVDAEAESGDEDEDDEDSSEDDGSAGDKADEHGDTDATAIAASQHKVTATEAH